MRYKEIKEAKDPISPEWKAIATDDYQKRDGRYPASDRPDTIEVQNWSEGTVARFSFKNTSQPTAEAWVKNFLTNKGLAFKKIGSIQAGDYRDDWVEVHALAAPPKRTAKPVAATPAAKVLAPAEKPALQNTTEAYDKSSVIREANGILRPTAYRLKTGDKTSTKVFVFTDGAYTGKIEANKFGSWLKDKGIDAATITKVEQVMAKIK